MIEDYLKKELDNLDYLVDNTKRINRKNRFIRNLKLTGNFIKYHSLPFILVGSLITGGLILTHGNLPFIKDKKESYISYNYLINDKVNTAISNSKYYQDNVTIYFDNNTSITININDSIIDDILNGKYDYISNYGDFSYLVVNDCKTIIKDESDLENIRDTFLVLVASLLITLMIPKDNIIFRYNKYTRNKELILFGHNDLDHKYLINAKKIREDNLKRLK